MATDSSVLMVVVMKDGSLIGSEVFPPGTYRLGRGGDMDLVLDDQRVSEHHASFLFTNGQIGIRDEGSQNGIYVNGEKVKSARVQPRDEVEVAPFILKMRLVQKRKETEPFDRAMGIGKSVPPAPSSQPITDETDELTVLAEQIRPPDQVPVRAQPAPARSPATPNRSSPRADPAGLLQPRPIPRAVVPVAAPSAPRAPPQASPRTPPPAPSLAAVPPPAPIEEDLPPPVHTQVTVRRKPRGHGHAPPATKGPAPLRALPHPMPPPTDTDLKSGTVLTKPVLRVQLLWGELASATVVAAHTFVPGQDVVGGPSDSFDVPIYGFPEKSRFKLAKYKGGKWQVTVPEGVDLHVRSGQGYARHKSDGNYELAEQESVVLRCGGVAVELISELASGRVKASYKPKLDKSYVIPLGIAFVVVSIMMIWSRTMKDIPDFQPKILPPARAILQPPKKKKPEPKQEKKKDDVVEKKKDEKKPEIAKKEPPKPNKPLVIQPPPAAEAVKKLLNTTKLLTAVNNIGKAGKMGNNMDYKASGLMGKLPLAMTGPGNILGLGKGMGGGGVMGGIGFAGLRGAGALGKGNVGRRGVASVPVTIPSGGRKVQGTLPMEAVQKVVDAHMNAIRQCYEGALVRNPSIAGKLIFEWTIGTDGNVKTAKTKLSTMPSADVGDCIRSSLVTWHFPLPKGGVVVVSYPFLFNAVGT